MSLPFFMPPNVTYVVKGTPGCRVFVFRTEGPKKLPNLSDKVNDIGLWHCAKNKCDTYFLRPNKPSMVCRRFRSMSLNMSISVPGSAWDGTATRLCLV